MPFYHKLGNIPPKRHTQFRKPNGDLYYEQLFGTVGFDGMSTNSYHEHRPTQVKDITKQYSVAPKIAKANNIDDVKAFILNEGLLNNDDITNIENFVQNIETDDFEIAINKFEEDIISQNLSEYEFIKYDNIASTVKILKDENPELFDNPDEVARGILGCLVAYVVWIAAIIGFGAACATVVLCVAAGIGLAAATVEVVVQCSIK